MNVVDSSAWLEYFADGPNAAEFAHAVETPEHLVVPALTVYEVYKRICQIRDESAALEAVGVMLQGRVVDLSATLAIESARLSLASGLAMADAVILATARAEEAVVWTQDSHFEGIPGVEYRRRTAS